MFNFEPAFLKHHPFTDFQPQEISQIIKTESNRCKPEPEGQHKTPHNAPDSNTSEIDLFHKSIEAHKLAQLSNEKYSFAELYQTGTWQKYEARAQALARKHPSRDPFVAYLSIDRHHGWPSANSRQSYRSALVRLSSQTVMELAPIFWRQLHVNPDDNKARQQLVYDLNRHLDDETRQEIKVTTDALSRADIKKLERAVEFLIQVPPDPEHTALRQRSTEPDGQVPKPRAAFSKKGALYALNQHQRRQSKTCPRYNWRDHLWQMAVVPDRYIDDTRRAAIAVLMLTGCRPSELSDELGVVIRSVEHNGQNYLAFEIAGSKLAEDNAGGYGKGQDRRRIELCCQTLEAIWLFDHVSKHTDGLSILCLEAPIQCQRGLPLMPTERRRRVTIQLGKILERLGRVAFPRLRHRLSPYVFRHALSSDFRALGDASLKGDIAMALGHQSTRTQAQYGSANTSRGLVGSRATQISRITAISLEKRAKVGDALRGGISWRCSDAVNSQPRKGYATCQRLPSLYCPIHQDLAPTRSPTFCAMERAS